MVKVTRPNLVGAPLHEVKYLVLVAQVPLQWLVIFIERPTGIRLALVTHLVNSFLVEQQLLY